MTDKQNTQQFCPEITCRKQRIVDLQCIAELQSLERQQATLDKLTQDTYKVARFFDMSITDVRLHVDSHNWVTGKCTLDSCDIWLPQVGIDGIHPTCNDSWKQTIAIALISAVS